MHSGSNADRVHRPEHPRTVIMIATAAVLIVAALGLLIVGLTDPSDTSGETSGSCGENLTWSIDSYGNLTITGYGPMQNYQHGGNWGGNVVKTVSLPVGITTIGNYAFSDCGQLISINLPDTITSIGQYAFSGCSQVTSITIPSSVTTIGSYAFYGCSSLNSVNIPVSLTYIHTGTFQDCSSLTAVSIPGSVVTIGQDAFIGCSSLANIVVAGDNPNYSSQNGIIFNKTGNQLVLYPEGRSNTSYTIPNAVTSIGSYAFYHCTHLTSVTIQNNVANIGSYAFCECTGLSSISIPYNVTTIGTGAFRDCSNLSSFSCSNYYLTSFGDELFSGCTSLSSINIPSSVTSIGNNAFYGCASLSSINIPSSVTSIGSNVFTDCKSLTSISVNSYNANYSSESGVLFNKTKTTLLLYPMKKAGSSYTIPGTVTTIAPGAFYDCSGLISVTIPNSVTSIGDQAFNGCYSLKSITIPNMTTSIGHYAFSGCSSLTSVSIPNTMVTINSGAFYGCISLSSITIPASVTTIGENAFYMCGSLTSIQVNSSNPNYSSENGVLFNKNKTNLIQYPAKKSGTAYSIPNSVTTISQAAFYCCLSVKSVTIPSSVTTIGERAFFGCSSLTSVTIPASVTSIGDNAFSFCLSIGSISVDGSNPSYCSVDGVLFNKGKTALIQYPAKKSGTTYSIPNTVTSIESYAFYGCGSLTTVTIPASVTSIDSYAFSECKSLTTVSIPISVTYIGYGVFYGCTSLTSINVEAANPDYSSENGVLYNKSKTRLIQYPSHKADLTFTVQKYVTKIEDEAFVGATYLQTINVNASNQHYSSENGILYNLSKTVLIQYPEGKTETVYNMPSSVESINNVGLVNNTRLLSISTGVGSKNYSTTNGYLLSKDGKTLITCPGGIETATVPNGVDAINSFAFYGNKLKKVVLNGNDPIYIANAGFYNCNSLEKIEIGSGVNLIYTDFSIIFTNFDEHKIIVVTPGGQRMTEGAMYGNIVIIYTDGSLEPIGNDVILNRGVIFATFDSDSVEYLIAEAESNSSLTLRISLGEGAVAVFDNNAIKAFNSGGGTLVLDKLTPAEQDPAIRKLVGSNPVYDITFGSTTSFGSGKVTITIPYKLPEGKNADDIKIFYIKNGEIAETIACTYADGMVTFKTSHLSTYSIGFDEPKNDNNKSLWMWVIVIVIAAVLIVGVFFVMTSRDNKTEADEKQIENEDPKEEESTDDNPTDEGPTDEGENDE